LVQAASCLKISDDGQAQQRRRVLEVWEAEERRDWSGDRRMQSADPHLDLLLGLLDVAGVRLFGQILVRPSWLPIVLPAAATCLAISGCHIACSPISKNVALRQLSASALSTGGVLSGQGRRRRSAQLPYRAGNRIA
jgi:hypothetical protein